jgi:low affinity Fe/Cu permease
MVFLIQNTQNRDNDIIHVKLDELIRATKSAEHSVLDLEALDNRAIHKLRKEYQAMGSHCETPHQMSSEQRADDAARDNLQR